MKTMEATRPHPPPTALLSLEGDRVCAARENLSDAYGAGYTRKELVHFSSWERKEESTRRLRIDEERAIDGARTAPLHERFHITVIALCASC